MDDDQVEDVLDSVESLDDSAQQNAFRYMAEADDDGIRLINEFDDQTNERFFDIGCSAGGASVGATATADTCPDGEDELVFTTTHEFVEKYGDVLDDLINNLESEDVDVAYTTFEDMRNK